MIKTIIFDLGEVYLNGVLGIEKELENILNIPEAVLIKQIHNIDLDDLFLGKTTETEFWNRIIVKNNWNIDAQLLKKITRKNFTPIKGTRDIIEKLKKAHYKLGLLSIHAKEWIDYCENKYKYHQLFDKLLYSFQAGLLKPDTRVYKLILHEMDALPEETLFIDDKERNTKAAQELGINTILFKNPEQLKTDLKKMNIKI